MAKDHFVSQVHLKQFLDPKLGHLTNAIRKSDLNHFTPMTKDVCRIEDGNTNKFLVQPRAIEEILKIVEPKFEPYLEKIRQGDVDHKVREVFSAYFAYILSFTPTALRMFDPMARALLNRLMESLETKGELEPIDCPELPDWHGKHATQLQSEGKLKLEIDTEMPQAWAFQSYEDQINSFANFDWKILSPKQGQGAFLCSDFPTAIPFHKENKYAQRIFPIAPDIIIWVDTCSANDTNESTSTNYAEIESKFVRKLNIDLIKSAETLVFSDRMTSSRKKLVAAHRNFRMDTVVDKIGSLLLSQQRTIPHKF